MRAFIRQLTPAFLAVVVFTLICGVVYPLLATAVGQVAFDHKVDGSLIEHDGHVVGSELIGQMFTAPEYFHSRPSAAGDGYDGSASSGSNLGPTNPDLLECREGTRRRLPRRRTVSPDDAMVPVDAVDGFGVRARPAHLRRQRRHPGRACGRPPADSNASTVLAMVHEYTEGRDLGVLGEPGVNVVRLNLALDELAP